MYMYVCKNSRGGGHPLLRLWGLVYGIPQGGFLFFELSMGVFVKGRYGGKSFLNVTFFFFFSEQLIHHKWESRSSVMVTVVKCGDRGEM